MSARNGNTARVTEVLRQYRDPITASEIADLLTRVREDAGIPDPAVLAGARRE